MVTDNSQLFHTNVGPAGTEDRIRATFVAGSGASHSAIHYDYGLKAFEGGNKKDSPRNMIICFVLYSFPFSNQLPFLDRAIHPSNPTHPIFSSKS
jgi:hypothetical protein